jgi:IS4 transposase
MLNDFHLAWRNIHYRLTLQLIKKTEARSDSDKQGHRCLIVDDTDLPKTGRRIELKSRERYHKKRSKESQGQVRVSEYAESKIRRMMDMVRLSIAQGIRFDYLLVDSWFTCYELVKFIKTRRIGCHFLGMIKAGKTLYGFNGKSLTSSQIVDELRRKRKMKHSKLLSCFYGEAEVDFKGMKVKLFFCKTSHKGKWHGLLTTHTRLSFEEAYKIYSTRWTIEVFFKEAKQHLGLGKCQSQDFDAQIASTTLCMLQYNLLSVAKRFAGYETLGELFRKAQADTLELTLNERIWLIILEIVTQIAELFETDAELLIQILISENEKLSKLLNFNSLGQAG